MKKIQVTLTIEESKELIAENILFHPSFKKSLKSGSIVFKGGTTVSRICEKSTGLPLRICGRITERGTVTSDIETDDPHTLLLKGGVSRNIDGNLLDELSALDSKDLIVCSANAIDVYGNAVLMAGSEGGGSIGQSISRWYTEGVKVLIPVGLEKLVPGNLNESIRFASRKDVDFSNGMSVGLLPLHGEIFTEVDAFRQLGVVDVKVIGSGGIGNANGSKTFQISGEDVEVDRILRVLKELKNQTIKVSGETVSLMECAYPSKRCKFHIGCSYKSGELKEVKTKKLGVITIGQSPRADFLKDIVPILSSEYRIVEKGALDDYEYEEITRRFKPAEGDTVLVSRLRDGRQVIIAEKHIMPLIQDAVYELERSGCKTILLMCTGKFPKIKHKSLLIKPQEIIPPLIKKIIDGGKLGIIIPDESQVDQMYKWWNMTEGLTVKFASPYENPENLKKAAEELKDEEVDIIYMDCMGYTREMKTIVESISGKTTMIPRTLAIGIINNL